MPQYDYTCKTCEKTFTVIRSIHQPETLTICPKGHKKTQRLYKPVNAHYKGEGFTQAVYEDPK